MDNAPTFEKMRNLGISRRSIEMSGAPKDLAQ